MSTRRRGREIALQILYQSEWKTIDDLDQAIEEYASGLAAKSISEDHAALAFARSRIHGVLAHKSEIDALLRDAARRWRLDRMASVDRNILRLGTFELCHCDDIPPRVAINEAVELGKRFGSGESSSFINGILDGIMKTARKTAAPAAATPAE
jgi:N utilization substance protein B